MLQILLTLFLAFLAFFSGTYLIYFAYIKKYAKKPWKLGIDRSFQPKISILIPVHNEERTIESKLRNIRNVSYPTEKIEVIIADDASEDKTLMTVENYLQNNPEFNAKIVRQNPHAGKSAALNQALAISTNEIVIVSDSDTIWPPDILHKALPYLSDSKVGVVTGLGINQNASQSWITKAEDTYLELTSLLRLGESKIHSTIRFEGGFCAYKKNAFERFDTETGSDDSGTALEVVQHNYRTLLAPEAIFYTQFPTRLIDKLKIKTRRANQLIGLWTKCFKLTQKKQLLLPKKIVIPEIILFIFNPVILLALMMSTSSLIAFYPFSWFSLAIILAIMGLVIFARRVFFEILLDNLILLYSLVALLFGKRYVAWKRPGITRS